MEILTLMVYSRTLNLLNQIKRAAITSLALGGIFLVLIGVYALLGAFLMAIGVSAEGTSYVVGLMSFINGAFHAGFEHLFGNLLILFIFLIPDINSSYGLKKLFWTSAVLSTIYIPVFILGLSWPVVGSSGVFYFLMGRFIFTRRNTVSQVFAYIFFSILILGDLVTMASNDGVAHLFHVMCAAIGVLTVTKFKKIIPEKINNLIT